MMKFMRKNKGFISIFLCLVLMPMVTFSTMVIDVSRMQNARVLIASAGDLAMNAGLSEYNKTLQEMYGIFATNTSDEKLKKALSNYFAKTISGSIGTSNKAEDDYVRQYADQFTGWIFQQDMSNMEFTNFIDMELEAADAFDYMGVNNSSPANPAVMKQQIVDYMKYKGPVSLSMNLLNKIGAMKDSKKQLDVVEKKVDYTQSLDNLTEPCKAAFRDVYGDDVEYETAESTKGYNDYVVDYNKFLEGDFKNGLNANTSNVYNIMKENVTHMSVFLVYYTTAKISAGMITGPGDKAGYNMANAGLHGLTYESFTKYLEGHPMGQKAYSSLGTTEECARVFDEFIGGKNGDTPLFSLNTVKDTQEVKFETTDFDKYFTKGSAKIKTETKNLSQYNKDHPNAPYLSKAELVADSAKLDENSENVSEALLNIWKDELKEPTNDEFSTQIEYDGRTYDLILQKFDREKKYKTILEFIKYYDLISDLKSKFDSNWSTFDTKVTSEIGTKENTFKTNENSPYNYAKTAEGIAQKERIDNLERSVASFEGENGKLAVTARDRDSKYSEYSTKNTNINNLNTQYQNLKRDCDDKEEEYNNETDSSKKNDLYDEWQQLITDREDKKRELNELKAETPTLDTLYNDYLRLKNQYEVYDSQYNSDKNALNTEKTAYQNEINKRNQAAHADAELIVKKDKKYYEISMEKEIVSKLYEQVKKRKETLENDVLDKIPERLEKIKDHGKPYLLKAMEQLEKFYVCVDRCYAWADKAHTDLQAVEGKYKEVKDAYDAWTASVDQVNDGTTKSTMMADAKNTSSGLKKKDITNSVSIALNRSRYFNRLKGMLENIDFFQDCKLIDSSKSLNYKASAYVDTLYEKILDHNKNTTIGDLDKDNRNSNYVASEKAKEIVGNHFKAPKISAVDGASVYSAFEWDLNQNLAKDTVDKSGSNFLVKLGDQMEGNKTTSLTGSAEAYDNEKFFRVLISIVKPKKNNDEDAKKSVGDIRTAKNDAVNTTKDDKSKSGGKSGGKASGEVQKQKSNAADEINVGEDVLKDIQKTIDEYKAKGGQNTANDKSVGSSGKNFTISDNQDKYKDNSKNAKESFKQASGLLDSLADFGANVLEKAYLEEYFTEMFTCQTDILKKNVDSGKKMLNGAAIKDMYKNDTAWYGGEMEYIIWGGDSVADAKVKNEVAIYALRFALNTIYAFTSAEIQEFTLAAATAIAGWTVVGVPLVQALLIIGLGAAESGVDLIKLKNGEDVVLFKNTSTFVCSPSGAIKEGIKTVAQYAIDETAKFAQKKFEQKIDELGNYATDTIGKHWDKIEKLKDDFVDEQTENIKSRVRNMILTPIMDKLKPIIMLKDTAEDTFKQEIDEALTQAFVDIGTAIDASGGGAIAEIANAAITKLSGPLRTEIMNKIDENSLLSVEGCYELVEAKVNGAIDSVGDKIKEKADDAGAKFLAEAEKCKSSLCGNAKELTGKWTTNAAESLSSKATDFVDSKFSDDAINKLGVTKKVDSGSSGGLTLNYKEYCKIFVLIGLASSKNEAGMLMRCAALCEANVKNPGTKFTADSNFKMVDNNTIVAVSAKVKLGTLFPWGVTVSENGATNDSSMEFDHLGGNYMTIEYQGVNAY